MANAASCKVPIRILINISEQGLCFLYIFKLLLELSRPWHVHGLPRNRLVEDGVFWAHPKYDPCVVEC